MKIEALFYKDDRERRCYYYGIFVLSRDESRKRKLFWEGRIGYVTKRYFKRMNYSSFKQYARAQGFFIPIIYRKSLDVYDHKLGYFEKEYRIALEQYYHEN